MIKLVVFDMAGTTVDEDNVVYKTVRKAINARGYEFSQQQVQESGAGKEKSQAIRDVLASGGSAASEEEVAEIFADFKLRLAQEYAELDVKEQPGASDVFRELRAKGVHVVLNTGYDRETATGLIEKLDWVVGRDIDALVTASDVSRGRPEPDMIHLAMEKTGVEHGYEVAKVGDSQIDIEEGQSANCGLTFGITTGAQSAELLRELSPSHVVDSLQEVADIVLRVPEARKHGPWSIHKSEVVYQDPWIRVQRDLVTRPDGEAGTYATVDLKSGVCVIAVDGENQVHLTREFHYAVGRDTIEGVSGGIEDGEHALDSAKRELAEELGLQADKFEHLGTVDPFTAAIDSTVDLYLATELTEGATAQEGTEVIEHVVMPLPEAIELVKNSQISHAPTCVALLLIALRET